MLLSGIIFAGGFGCLPLSVKHGNSIGKALVAIPLYTTRGPTATIDAQDVNRDGYPDLLTASHIYLNPAGKLEADWKPVDLNLTSRTAFFLNVDDDGLPDIIGYYGFARTRSLPADQQGKRVDKIYWIEALDPEGVHWSETVVIEVPYEIALSSSSLQKVWHREQDREVVIFNRTVPPLFLEIPQQPEVQNWAIREIHPDQFLTRRTPGNILYADFNKDERTEKAVLDVQRQRVEIWPSAQ